MDMRKLVGRNTARIRREKGLTQEQLAERLVAEATVSLARQGADACVAACTELPLVSGSAARVLPVIDSLECLARAAVRHCLPLPTAGGSVVVPPPGSASAVVERALEQP